MGRSHVVQFYSLPSTVHEAITSWIEPALVEHGGAVVIATPAQATGVRQRVREAGLDVAALESEGRLRIFDAEETMAKFLVDGLPDGDRFRNLMEGIFAEIRSTCGDPGIGIRAWGEMVDLLRRRGNPRAGRQLEELWNEVIDGHNVDLLCSYDIGNPLPPEYVAMLRDLTHGHTAMLAADDQHLFDERIFAALTAHYGLGMARRLWPLLRERYCHANGIEMPPGKAVVMAVEDLVPGLGVRLVKMADAGVSAVYGNEDTFG